MKLNHLKIFVVLSLSLIFGCSSNEEQKPEVRFVDLQGNARSIKTRVPEANAKIMSGQSYNYNSQQSNPKIYNEYIENKKNSAEIVSPKDKDLIAQKNNFTPKFTDSDTYIKNPQAPQSKFENNKMVETENQNVAEDNEPVVEYDLSKEDDSNNKIANRNNLSQKESLGQENESSIDKKRMRANKNNLNTNESAEYSEEDVDESKNNKLLKKGPKFITYSNKKNGLKAPKTNDIAEDESQEERAQYIGKSGGKVYVQVGSFFTSSGAKQRLLKSKELGKGKVLVAYNKQNKRIYRSVYGPFKSKNSALKFRDKIIDSGNEAIIINSK
jgi:cell division protein FtsN